jgi:hypothetical protein
MKIGDRYKFGLDDITLDGKGLSQIERRPRVSRLACPNPLRTSGRFGGCSDRIRQQEHEDNYGPLPRDGNESLVEAQHGEMLVDEWGEIQ